MNDRIQRHAAALSHLIAFATATSLAACGGGGTSSGSSTELAQAPAAAPAPAPATAPLTGTVVLGQGIQGLNYRTATQSGLTDAQGSYRYLDGETVVLSVGGLRLQAAARAAPLRLTHLTGSASVLDRPVQNAAALLYSLDTDRNASNGVRLNTAALDTQTQPLTLDQPRAVFATTSAAMLAQAGNGNTGLLDEATVLNTLTGPDGYRLQAFVPRLVLPGGPGRLLGSSSDYVVYPTLCAVGTDTCYEDQTSVLVCGGRIDYDSEEQELVSTVVRRINEMISSFYGRTVQKWPSFGQVASVLGASCRAGQSLGDLSATDLNALITVASDRLKAMGYVSSEDSVSGAGTPQNGASGNDPLNKPKIDYSFTCPPVDSAPNSKHTVQVSNGVCLAQQKAYTYNATCNIFDNDLTLKSVGKPFYACLVNNSNGEIKAHYQQWLDFFD